MKKSIQLALSITIFSSTLISLNSCQKTSAPTRTDGDGSINHENGLLIVNEGSFGSGNASMSFYSPGTDVVSNNIFSSTNSRPLGDVAQSATRIGNSTYICVNVSNKIEVVNSSSFVEEATITSVNQPRYMIAKGNTGYVSSWDGNVAVLDLTSNALITTITVGSGPEKMVINNNQLYVANSGGFGSDSTISVIDISTNTVTTTITIDGYNPSAIINGANNTIWVLAKGKTLYDVNWNVIGHAPSKLIKINTTTNTVISSTSLFPTLHPSTIDMSPDGATIYIGGSFSFPAIYTTSTSSPTTPSAAFINEVNYGFFVNSSNGNVFILQDGGSSNGKLLRYNSKGTKIGEYTVGIFPNGGSNRLSK